MKTKAAVIVCLFVIIGAWAYVHAQTSAASAQSALPSGANGRYQVVSAEFDSGWEGQPNKKMIIRTDTQTGKTWTLIEYADATADGKTGEHHRVWAELGEFK